MAKSTTKKTEETKVPTLRESLSTIDASRKIPSAKSTIEEKKKSKRGPSEAGRISGLKSLQTLNPKLGQQFL